MGPGGAFNQRERMMNKLKEKKPESIREIPGYIWRVVSKFFGRLFYIYKIVWEVRKWILFFMLSTSVWNGVLPVINSIIGMKLLNALADAYVSAVNGGENMFRDIIVLLIVKFAVSFLGEVISRVSNMINNISGELVVNHVNMKIMEKAKEVDLSSFDDPDFYERLENAKREAGIRPITILNNNFNIVSIMISIISFIIILSAVSPLMSLVIILISIPTAVINFAYRKKNFYYMRFHSKERRQMSYYSEIMTNKDMVKEIRLFDLSGTFIERYKKTFEKYFGGLKKLFLGEGFWNIIITLITTAANCVMFLIIAKGVTEGKYQVGYYSLYVGTLQSIAGGIASLIATTASIYEGTLFIDNLINFLNEKRTIVPATSIPRAVKHHTGHTVEFKNVSFAYPGSTKKVLNNINFTINEGDTCVLVGLNGAGKTTLIKLLTRLYDPTEGMILLDGHDIREYDVRDLYSIFGIIFQDFGKYAVSVRENIEFGDIEREHDDEKVKAAAAQSDAENFINELPGGYETPLMRYFEENGIELSVGQWQKLSVARAFYSDSDIVILDEPTASLDAVAEQEIYNQFDTFRENKTTVFVSHRLSSATIANKIIVLNNGGIAEMGNHAELMKKQGLYYKLFTTQAKRYITPTDGDMADNRAAKDGRQGDLPGSRR